MSRDLADKLFYVIDVTGAPSGPTSDVTAPRAVLEYASIIGTLSMAARKATGAISYNGCTKLCLYFYVFFFAFLHYV